MDMKLNQVSVSVELLQSNVLPLEVVKPYPPFDLIHLLSLTLADDLSLSSPPPVFVCVFSAPL